MGKVEFIENDANSYDVRIISGNDWKNTIKRG